MRKPEQLFRPIFSYGESLGELILRPVNTFIALQVSGGILTLAATIAALILANSALVDVYDKILHNHISISVVGRTLDKPIHFWINEGLMTVFFFVVGLEIKREILVGELASLRRSLLPIAAAIGGMVVPALIYISMNTGEALKGWAVPVATDIAFTIAALTLLRSHIPHSLTIFVAALAIVDDLGAVLIIALFYTSQISTEFLWITALLFLLLGTINFLGYKKPLPYIVLGCLVWFTAYLSGIHSTIAGVLVAMSIPARSKSNTDQFLGGAYGLLDQFECAGSCGYSIYTNVEHQEAVRKLETLCRAVEPPLLRIQNTLNPWVINGIIPLFALANAGVEVSLQSLGEAFRSSSSLGVFAGLFFGKQIGIFAASWIAVRSGLAQLPSGTSWFQLYCCAILCGTGFTMSIFIADLAFKGSELLSLTKLSILMASTLSLVVGLTFLYLGSRSRLAA